MQITIESPDPNMTISDYVGWLRKEGNKLLEEAAGLERRFIGGGVTLQQVHDYLRLKGARMLDIAKHFSTPIERVRTLVSSADSGLTIGARGWISITKQSQ